MDLFSKLFGAGDAKNDVNNNQVNFAEGDFSFQVEDVLAIAGRGIAVTGSVISSDVRVGDTIVINGHTESEVTGIEMPGKISEIAKAGDICCLFLNKISKQDVKKGNYLTLLKRGQQNSDEQKTSDDLICRNCGNKLNGEVCEKCGYNANPKYIFKNIITDIKAKEDVGDNVLAYLINLNKIDKSEFNGLIIEFGYLFLDNDNVYESLLKIITPNKKIFYVAIQHKSLMLLENGFNEEMFRKTAQDMLKIHRVDINNMNPKDYSMQLS